MLLDNRTYDILKWFVLVLLPALAVLVQGLGDLYGVGQLDMYVSTINLFTVFVGTILQLSSRNYNNHGGGTDGYSATTA